MSGKFCGLQITLDKEDQKYFKENIIFQIYQRKANTSKTKTNVPTVLKEIERV